MARANKKAKRKLTPRPSSLPGVNPSYSRADRLLQLAAAVRSFTTAAPDATGAVLTQAALTSTGSAILLDYFEEALRSFARASNVDISAAPAERATQMLALLDIVESDLDDGQSGQKNTKRFLLHVAWHEGAKLTKRVQMGNGPARSFFQFEMARAKDAGDYAVSKGLLDKLAAVSDHTADELEQAIDELSSGSSFPPNNLIRSLLETNDLFGCYLARIAFKRVPAAIPTTNAGHADYWYKYWKVTGGDPVTLKKIFVAEADEVDALA